MIVGVVGLGLIGSYVAVRLSNAGIAVRATGRSELDPDALRSRRAIDLSGQAYPQVTPIDYAPAREDLAACSVILVATKSAASPAIARTLPQGVRVLSLQNGLNNPPLLADTGEAKRVRPVHGGVVTFNVRRGGGPGDKHGAGDFIQTTSGPIVIAKRTHDGHSKLPHAPLVVLWRSGIPIEVAEDFPSVARAKLLLNLNNGVCAAAGVSVADSIADRRLRRVYGACIREGLAVFEARHEAVGRIGPLAPGIIARFITWPDAVVRVLARPMIKIDPLARSSTLVDLEAGLRTEVDELNGYIADEGERLGVPCPANREIERVIRQLEGDATNGRPLQHPSIQELHDRIAPQ